MIEQMERHRTSRLQRLISRLRGAGKALWGKKRSPMLIVTMPSPHTRHGGETVYNEAALRFRKLSISEPDLPTFGDLRGSQEGFKIRVARLPVRRHEARRMVDKRYAGRGYRIPLTPDAPEPHLSTFLAYDEGCMVGTVSVRLDSTAGLSADDLYPEELDRLRRAGHRLCEFTRLAVDSKAATKAVLAGLFHTAYLYASRLHGFTHAVIEVNPRHVAFYRRSLGFEIVGEERLNKRVCAPAVLLEVPFTRIDEGLHRAGRAHATGRASSLLLHGFPPGDETGVLERLREKERVS
ncbi:MAG: hypothetical protein IPO82_04330 [Betaproteobacteria bacterium]|nr:hypothetical protein [Betaproteobacteria bacterium]